MVKHSVSGMVGVGAFFELQEPLVRSAHHEAVFSSSTPSTELVNLQAAQMQHMHASLELFAA
jgi:hypothetical protein